MPLPTGRHRAPHEERRVVVAPRGGELHQRRRAWSGGSTAGRCRARCCGRRSSCWRKQLHGVPARVARRGARAERLHPQHLLEDVEALDQQRLLLLAALHEEGLLVEVAVVAHLVAAADDVLAEGGVALHDPARDEDAGLDAVAVEEVEDARHAGLGPVGAHRHVQRPLRQRGVAVDPRALAIEVERHHDGAPGAVGPSHRLCHRVLRRCREERARPPSRQQHRPAFPASATPAGPGAA